MRVLYDYQAFEMQRIGGVSRYYYELLRRVPNATLALRFSDNLYIREEVSLKSQILEPDYYFNRFMGGLSFRGKRRLFNCLGNIRWSEKHDTNRSYALRVLQKHEYDIFHPTYYDPYFLEANADVPFVITVHDMIHEKYPELFPIMDSVRKQKEEVLQKASRIIAISENTKKDILEAYPIDPDKIRVIYHGSCLKKEPISILPLPEKYILYTGTRSSYKNFSFFLISIARMLKEKEDLYLVCTGPLFSADELSFFASLGLSQKVLHFEADEKAIYHVYNRARCFVFPSYYEGFGIPVLEAFEAKCPVILARASCFPEIADNAALYFDPKNSMQLEKTVSAMLESENLRKELAERGLKRLANFSWDETAAKTVDCYKELV